LNLYIKQRGKKDFTLKYKRYAKPYMSPTKTNRTNKQRTTLKYKRHAKPCMSPTGTNRTNKETNDKGLTNTQSTCKVLKFKKNGGVVKSL